MSKSLMRVSTVLPFVAGAIWIATTGGCGSSNSSTPASNPGAPGIAGSVTVNIPAGAMNRGPQAFGVNPMTVAAGTVVTWTNTDSIAHTSTSDSGVWDSGTLAPGQSYSYTFSSPGTFPYHCAIHGAASMSGVIQVTGSAAPY